MEKTKFITALTAGAVVTFFDKYHLILIFVILAIILDVITGIIKALATGEGLSSKKGHEGFWKKISLLVALLFGMFLDYFMPYCIAQLNIPIKPTALFTVIIGCYICINELISICENLFTINPDIIPKWIVRMLEKTKEKINEQES